MASKAVVEAVKARIGETWTSQDATALPVSIEDGINSEGETPADGSPYLVVEFRAGNETQFTLGDPGNNEFLETGNIYISINEVRGNGTSRALGWADELRALFRGQYFDGVQTTGANPPDDTNDNDVGNYWQMSLVIEYRYFLLG